MVYVIVLCVWVTAWTLWESFIVRYSVVHIILAIPNFILYFLFLAWGYDHYVATVAGHAVHIGLGFFLDKHISYRSEKTTVKKGMWRYWVVEIVSFGSIFVTLYFLVDLWNWDPMTSRVVFATLIATAISIVGNWLITFE